MPNRTNVMRDLNDNDNNRNMFTSFNDFKYERTPRAQESMNNMQFGRSQYNTRPYSYASLAGMCSTDSLVISHDFMNPQHNSRMQNPLLSSTGNYNPFAASSYTPQIHNFDQQFQDQKYCKFKFKNVWIAIAYQNIKSPVKDDNRPTFEFGTSKPISPESTLNQASMMLNMKVNLSRPQSK